MTGPIADSDDLLWQPADATSTQAFQFRQHVNAKFGLALNTYEDLWRWSVEHRADFWSELWDWEGVVGDKGGDTVVDERKSPADNPAWFPEASLNWAENQLRHHLDHPDDVAIIDFSEPCAGWDAPMRMISQAQLFQFVARTQAGMVEAGVKKGHRVAYWGGNRAEAAIVLLATSACGAIFSSVAADFGVGGVIERLEQIKPKLLFVSNGVVYNAQPRPLLPLLPQLFAALSDPPSRTVVIEHLPSSLSPALDLELPPNVCSWEDFLSVGAGMTEVHFKRIGFDEPIWILFSSGTTGKPKAIVGGQLLDSLREHHLAGDMTRGDIYFYYTTPGWMMFQYLVSGLATGATVVMYEGSPLKRPEYLWEKIDELGVTIFGASAKYIEQVSSILMSGKSTASRLCDRYCPQAVRSPRSCSTLSTATSRRTSCSAPSLAAQTSARCLQAATLRFRSTAARSSLECSDTTLPRAADLTRLASWSCSAPSPSSLLASGRLTLTTFPTATFSTRTTRPRRGRGSSTATSEARRGSGIMATSKRSSRFPARSLTRSIMITPSRAGNGGGIIMLGRSDGVLNPAGIRFGPADIYTVVETPAFVARGIEETLVTAIEVDGGADERVVLFVKMAPGFELSPQLVAAVKGAIKTARSARHVPTAIVAVSDVPVTLTGKKIEVQIKKVVNGGPVAAINPDTLRNPECLAEYADKGRALCAELGGRRAAL